MEKVGPHLRHSVKRAVRSADERRMTQVGHVVVGELLRRGDLLRVAVEGSGGPVGPLYLLKGTTRLLDLSALGGSPFQANGPGAGPSMPGGIAPLEEGRYRMEDFAGILGVMEQAQELDLGNPSSSESGVVLTGILKLLSRLIPQFNLFVMVDESQLVPEDQNFVFQLTEPDPSHAWLSSRSPGQSYWIPDPIELPAAIRKFENASPDDEDSWRGQGLACAVAVPLWEPSIDQAAGRRPKEAGLFFLVSREQWDKAAMLKLARRLVEFVTRRWQRQSEVNLRIHKDGLTGVFNRAYFDDQLTLELERARRANASLTLVIADLDSYKAVNDQYGHQVGDIVLQRVVRRMQKQLRRIDSICRIGGDEFALILPQTSEAAGQDVIRRLLGERTTEEIPYLDEVLTIDVTFSYGAATFPDAASEAFELYRKADDMTFRSKEKGRNQCHIYSNSGDHKQLLP